MSDDDTRSLEEKIRDAHAKLTYHAMGFGSAIIALNALCKLDGKPLDFLTETTVQHVRLALERPLRAAPEAAAVLFGNLLSSAPKD